jgi:hypothetical protein
MKLMTCDVIAGCYGGKKVKKNISKKILRKRWCNCNYTLNDLNIM